MIVIASAFGPTETTSVDLGSFPSVVEATVRCMEAAERLALRWTAVSRLVIVSRGYGYPAALEVALKLTETTGIPAQGFSAADLRHGPMASVGPQTAVLILDTAGPGSHEPLAEIATIASARGASIGWCSTSADADLPLPSRGQHAEPLTAHPSRRSEANSSPSRSRCCVARIPTPLRD